MTMIHQQRQHIHSRRHATIPSSSSMFKRISYLHLGPTTTHLLHELYLWIALVLLQISYLHNLYGSSESSESSPSSSSFSMSDDPYHDIDDRINNQSPRRYTTVSYISDLVSSPYKWMTAIIVSFWNGDDDDHFTLLKSRINFGGGHGTFFDDNKDDVADTSSAHMKRLHVGVVILLSALWMARFLWVRWILTTGSTIKCTSKSPTLSGLIAHWISSHIIAGQVLDRPPNPSVVAKQIGVQYVGYGSNSSAIVAAGTNTFDGTGTTGLGGSGGGSSSKIGGHNYYSQGGGGGFSGGIWTMVWLRRFIPPSVAFTWQYIKIWFWYPFLSTKEKITGAGQQFVTDDTHVYESNVTGDTTNSMSHTSNPSSIDGRSQYKGGRRKHAQQQKSGGPVGLSSLSGSGPSLLTSTSSSSLLGSPPPASRTYLSYMYSFISKIWRRYGPSLQMLIPVTTLVLLIWYKLQEDDTAASAFSSTTLFGNSRRRYHALTLHALAGASLSTSQSNVDPSDASLNQPYGSYQRLEPPSWTSTLYYLCATSVACSILLYGRIILPLPDLVIGSSVLKAIRNEAKSSSSNASSFSSSLWSIFNITGFLGIGARPSSKSSGRSSQRDSVDTPWLERYKSIVDENRFRLVCKVASLRLIENLWVCILFPRTLLVCRFTRHCPTTVTTMDLQKILYYAGTELPHDDETETYENHFTGSRDLGATVLITVSVIVITVSMLLAQAATLNRSYLGIMGYLTGEWVLVDADDPSLADSPRPSPWDPRRRYKKGDLISLESPSGSSGSRVVYRANSNSPEGRPYDLFLRASHEFFRNELGHPASSHLIAFLSTVQFGLISVSILMILLYELILRRPTASLLWTLAANLVAVYGIMIVSTPKYREIARLSDEISS